MSQSSSSTARVSCRSAHARRRRGRHADEFAQLVLARRDREHRDREGSRGVVGLWHQRGERRHSRHDAQGSRGRLALDMDRRAREDRRPQRLSVVVRDLGSCAELERADSLSAADDERVDVYPGQRHLAESARQLRVQPDRHEQAQSIRNERGRRIRRRPLLRQRQRRELARADHDAAVFAGPARFAARGHPRRVAESGGAPARELPREHQRVAHADDRVGSDDGFREV